MKKTIMRFVLTAAMMPCLNHGVAQQTVAEATDSVKSILENAKKGDAAAQNEVGAWYYRGRHVKQDYKEAMQWWAKSAKQDNTLAIGNLGMCYQYGNGTSPDSVKAAALYISSIKRGNSKLLDSHREMAKKGSPFSNMLLAQCHLNGNGVDKSTDLAKPYLETAAAKGSADANATLGEILLKEKDYPNAARYLKSAAEKGNMTSACQYGRLAVHGNNTALKKEGADWLLKSAESGHPAAMYETGMCYLDGNGLVKNPEQAIVWLRKGAGAGNRNAIWQLAECFRLGNGHPVDYDQALYWYAEASGNGDEKKVRQLLTDSLADSPFGAYLKGMKLYMAKDFEGALKQFKSVEKGKVDDGKVMTAAILANADYKKPDPKKSVKLLTQVADTNPMAMYLLGGLYEAGKGTEKDPALALKWFTRSADAGYAPAQCALGDIYYEGRGLDKDNAKAAQYYAMAESQGRLTENAAKRYASILEAGTTGIEADAAKAEQLKKEKYGSRIAELLNTIVVL